MIERIRLHDAASRDVAENLALESELLASAKPGELIFYLWQNDPTVVIGRHQIEEVECDLEYMKEAGIALVRRRTGGGAVYQDAGNLNYSFLCRLADYDEPAFVRAVLRALSRCGVEAVKSDRNDLLLADGGQKISGTASLVSGDFCIFHGTLLLDVDLAVMERVLRVEPKKLARHGVASVRSRVRNMKDVVPDLTMETLREQLVSAVSEIPYSSHTPS